MKFSDFKTAFKSVLDEVFKAWEGYKNIQDEEDNYTVTLSEEEFSDVKVDFQIINSTPLEEEIDECVLFVFIGFGNMDSLIPVIERSVLIATRYEEPLPVQFNKFLSEYSWELNRIENAVDEFKRLSYPIKGMLPER